MIAPHHPRAVYACTVTCKPFSSPALFVCSNSAGAYPSSPQTEEASRCAFGLAAVDGEASAPTRMAKIGINEVFGIFSTPSSAQGATFC